VVPYLPLNELTGRPAARPAQPSTQSQSQVQRNQGGSR
jgi:hypothetical protein